MGHYWAGRRSRAAVQNWGEATVPSSDRNEEAHTSQDAQALEICFRTWCLPVGNNGVLCT